jgi:hypothetical protein
LARVLKNNAAILAEEVVHRETKRLCLFK